MPLSYAQNLEDYHLSLAFPGVTDGIYVDIGAGHPVADNVTYWFYLQGWSGVVVEPQADLAALYRRLRPRDTIFEGVVGRQSGTAAFHSVDRFHGLSSLVEDFARQATALGASYSTVHRPSLTLADLCQQHGLATIDILKVDVEGAEADVFAGADFGRFRPKVIVAEAIAPGTGAAAWQAWEPALLAADYEFVLFDTLNRFYVAREQAAVLERFPRERAAWDVATHMYEIGRAPENGKHPEHAMARALARGLWALLPELDARVVAELLLRGESGRTPEAEKVQVLAAALSTDEGRARLGRIACGYDGGQIVDEEAP